METIEISITYYMAVCTLCEIQSANPQACRGMVSRLWIVLLYKVKQCLITVGVDVYR